MKNRNLNHKEVKYTKEGFSLALKIAV